MKIKHVGCLLLFILFHRSALPQYEKLNLEIKLSKNNFLLSEAILVNVFLRNVTSDTVVCNELSVDKSFLYFVIQDERGKKYELTHPRFNGKPFGLKIPPNSVEYWLWNIKAAYGINSNYKHYPSKHYLPVGRYSVTAEFQSGYGMMKSNILKFEIVEPQNAELEAFKLLEHADDLRLEKKFDKALSVLDSLKEKHPQSVYRPMALLVQIFIRNYEMQDELETYHIARTLIDAYPSSEYALMGLSQILTHIGAPEKDKKIRKEILEYVIRKYPGTKVAEFGEKTLNGDKARE